MQEEKKQTLHIKYGMNSQVVDVTFFAFQKCLQENNTVIVIPRTDNERALLFGDPYYGVIKEISVQRNGDEKKVYPQGEEVRLVLSEPFINLDDAIAKYQIPPPSFSPFQVAERKLQQIHANLKFQGGTLQDEYPEQLMSVMFICPNDKVLEIGSNLGRNTLTIMSLLSNQSHLVTLECNPEIHKQLLINRELNQGQFHAENAALSYRPLIIRGWDSKPAENPDVIPDGFLAVNTITFQQLQEKYHLVFNVLVADCEGALYYILLDNSHILDNIQTVIMENDYHDKQHKDIVDKTLVDAGFVRVFVRGGGWGPCIPCFYETWQKPQK